MTTLADKAILSGANNRPPMLEKDMYDSWKRKMELYMMNKQHGRMILEFVENGRLIWPTIEENGVTRPRKYSELSLAEAIQADCDVKATNIILQGLPLEVYALNSMNSLDPSPSCRPTKFMVPKELPKVSMDQGLIIAALKDEIRKHKGKALDDNAVTIHTITLEMLNVINDVNAYPKSKFVKKTSKRKVWKLTGKVFTKTGYTWRPTGRTFTIVGNACPTITTEVPFRKLIALENDAPKHVVTLAYSRKPRKSKTNVPVGISHETSIARSPQQNGVVERRNRMLIEATCTILEPVLHEMTPATISSGLMPNPSLLTPFVPPLRTDWNILFQPLFDELLTPPPSVDLPASKVIAPIANVVPPKPAASTGSPSSTIVDQDAPVPDVIPTVVHTAAPNSEHVTKWTMDHPLDNIIGELERPVSIRL
nr:retrovirus-related Pol polyprotein from transposon TNT 1-94 [Tanacetum cinerariifolium]